MAKKNSEPKQKHGGRRNGAGRKKGTPNKFTYDLREALHIAAERVGMDCKGFGGLTGYLIRLAIMRPGSFAAMLGKTMPTEVKKTVTHTLDLGKLSDDEMAIMERLTQKAQIPKLVAPESQEIIDLHSNEYEAKVDSLLNEADEAAVAEQ